MLLYCDAFAGTTRNWDLLWMSEMVWCETTLLWRQLSASGMSTGCSLLKLARYDDGVVSMWAPVSLALCLTRWLSDEVNVGDMTSCGSEVSIKRVGNWRTRATVDVVADNTSPLTSSAGNILHDSSCIASSTCTTHRIYIIIIRNILVMLRAKPPHSETAYTLQFFLSRQPTFQRLRLYGKLMQTATVVID